jgi:ATP-dependent RNA helicase DeaD
MRFEEINLRPEILGFEETTEIQSKCIPEVLKGKDLVGQSQTGSGKTAAFGLPILNSIMPGMGIQAIILTPTRELGVQVHEALVSFAKFTHLRMACVYGGVGLGPQVDALRNADLVVGTPGRVLDHLERRTMNLSKVKFFVLDEADRMLEMGFIDDVKKILSQTPRDKQSLLFSATMPTQIRNIIAHNFRNPQVIKGQVHVDRSLLRQVYYNIRPEEKFSLLVHLLKSQQGVSLIFCATRNEVDVVERNLKNNGIKAMAIHGGLTQSKRLQVVDMLKNEETKVLVATDVAARGLDIKNITHVYNYDLPNGPEDYTHRIGRTARAGEDGDAITLLTQNDYGKFQTILNDRTIKVNKLDTPQFQMLRFERHRSGFGGRPQGRSYGRPGGRFGGRSEGRGGSERGHSSEGEGHRGRSFNPHHRRSTYRR